VGETSIVWQSQLDWEKDRHEDQTKRLPKANDRMMRKYSEFEELCSEGYSHQGMESLDTLMDTIALDFIRLQEVKESCEMNIQDSERKIADLEQKLRSAPSS
jgi:hypothetical protein